MYNKCFLPEHQGNPLIEALPPLVDDPEVILKLRSQQICLESEADAPAFIRKKYLHRLEQFVEPTYEYLECFRMIEDLITQSYIPKNPLTNTAQHWLFHDRPEESKQLPSQGLFVPRSAAMAVVGDGGAGKSWMLESIVRSYPQIIEHTSYKGKPLNFRQVVWIKVNCTENANVKAMLILILEELDRLTGSDEARRALSSRDPVAAASLAISRKMKSTFLGVLIIDEMQHLQFANSKLKELFIQFILNTLGRAGVPIVFGGDPRIETFLKSGLPVSRRVETGGFIYMRGWRGHEWDLFVEQLWNYQWTKIKTPLTAELSNCLSGLSTGLPDFAVRIFKAAQSLVIGTENETISAALLRQAYNETCMLSDGKLLERKKKLDKEENHQNIDFGPSDTESNVAGVASVSSDPPKSKSKSRKIHDVNRIQHDEFETQIHALKDRIFLPLPGVTFDVVRRSAEDKDLLGRLLENKLLLRQSVLMAG